MEAGVQFRVFLSPRRRRGACVPLRGGRVAPMSPTNGGFLNSKKEGLFLPVFLFKVLMFPSNNQ